MGFPISRFAALHELATNKEVKQEFKRFKWIAIVLNGPKNIYFKRTMQKNFEQLDIQTGHSFLFLSFINRPHGWNPGYDLIRDGKQVLTADNYSDDSSLMYAFCRRADISTHNLPKILLISDFDATEYIALPTDSPSVCDQLVRIGQFCDEQSESISTMQMAKWLKKNMPKHSLAIGVTAEPISAILTDLYAASDPDVPYNCYHKDAILRQEEAKERLYDTYQNASNKDKNRALSNYLDYEAYCEKGKQNKSGCIKDEATAVCSSAESFSLLSENKWGRILKIPKESSPHIKKDRTIDVSWIKGCEPESKQLIVLYNYLCKPTFLDRIQNRPIDKMLYTRYIGEFLETEINYSLVQHIRKVLGIPFPKFYMEYYPCANKDAYKVTAKNEPVSFNAYDKINEKQELRSVTPGKVVYAYQDMIEDTTGRYQELKRYGDDFIKSIHNIVPYFNINKHQRKHFNPQDNEIVYEHFISFLRDVYPQLVELKTELRPQNPNSNSLY